MPERAQRFSKATWPGLFARTTAVLSNHPVSQILSADMCFPAFGPGPLLLVLASETGPRRKWAAGSPSTVVRPRAIMIFVGVPGNVVGLSRALCAFNFACDLAWVAGINKAVECRLTSWANWSGGGGGRPHVAFAHSSTVWVKPNVEN